MWYLVAFGETQFFGFTGYPARPYTLFAKQEDQKHAFSS